MHSRGVDAVTDAFYATRFRNGARLGGSHCEYDYRFHIPGRGLRDRLGYAS